MNKSNSMGKLIFRVVFIVFAILLLISFARKLYGGADLSFSAFLNWLGNVDSFGFTKIASPWYIGGDWGIIDALRKFFNSFGNAIGVLFFICANLIGVIQFVSQFLLFIFV